MNQVKVFCPANVANLSCGFDVMGLCIDTIGDEMISKKGAKKGVTITKIVGANLPFDVNQNVAGVSALAMLEKLNIDFGFEIEIYKNIKAGSGISSSSASAAGTVFGINALLNYPFSNQEMVYFATQGEVLASGSADADNVAPCLLRGFTLVRSSKLTDVVEIPSPKFLFTTVIHPHIELKISAMRDVLPASIPLKNAITQWGNVGGLVAGLFTSDYDLIRRSLTDVVVEPVRSSFIPEFENLKTIALSNGGLGCGIAGSGPSVFVLSKGKKTAENIAALFRNHFSRTSSSLDVYVSKIATVGCRIM